MRKPKTQSVVAHRPRRRPVPREGNSRYAFSFRLRENKGRSRFVSIYSNENGTFLAVTEGADFQECYLKALDYAQAHLKNLDAYTLHSVQST